MLILDRRVGQKLILSNIYDADGNRLLDIIITKLPDHRLGIRADKSITIMRDNIVKTTPSNDE